MICTENFEWGKEIFMSYFLSGNTNLGELKCISYLGDLECAMQSLHP
jgi:hypothetical protein